jgi:hypothetical protein
MHTLWLFPWLSPRLFRRKGEVSLKLTHELVTALGHVHHVGVHFGRGGAAELISCASASIAAIAASFGATRAILAIGNGTVYHTPGQAGPGNDINAGSSGFQKAPTRGPASLVTNSGGREPSSFETTAQPQCSDRNANNPSGHATGRGASPMRFSA